MTADLRDSDHRPWPVPSKPWFMGMRWEHLGFLHWRFPAAEIQAHLPDGLTVDLFEGEAFLGVVPFLMNQVHVRGLPSIPGTHRFAELNVRTYVTDGKRPGVWFFSLDAASRLAVRGARTTFHLPYFDARMCCEVRADHVEYESRRTHRGQSPATFEARYGPSGEEYAARPGDLDHWLTERYCLYSGDARGRVRRGEVHHRPWPLQRGWAEIGANELFQGDGLSVPEGEPMVHVVEGLDVLAWWPDRVR